MIAHKNGQKRAEKKEMATNRGSPWALEMINKSLIKHQLIEDRAPTRDFHSERAQCSALVPSS